MRLLALLLIMSCPAFGYEVVYTLQGAPAKFTGYLITPETEQYMRYLSQELDYQKQLNVSLVSVNKSYEDNNVIMQTRINNLQTSLDKAYTSSDGFFSKYGVFILGAATATLITFGVSRATK